MCGQAKGCTLKPSAASNAPVALAPQGILQHRHASLLLHLRQRLLLLLLILLLLLFLGLRYRGGNHTAHTTNVFPIR